MIRISRLDELAEGDILSRGFEYDDTAEETVAAIIEDVRKRGDAALAEYTKRFDGVTLSALEVTKQEFDEAQAQIDPYFAETLRQAKENIAEFHKHQLHENFVLTEKEGAILGQRYTPIAKVGIYVPGGTAAYPSSVLMNAVPAKLAGVEEIVMVTPPGPDGTVPAVILAAARLAGVDRVFKIGGAQAVAALAYGTKTVPKVQKIVGPGNKYVATAKRRVFGLVDIDMIAGPSEILIIADETANARHVAADMLSQAEHGTDSSAIVLTDSQSLAEAILRQLTEQLETLPRAADAAQSLRRFSRVIVVASLDEAVRLADEFASEHLEIQCGSESRAVAERITNAGAIFIGPHTPVAVSLFRRAEPVLPTGGTAKFSSPLSVDDFVKKSSFIYYTKEALGGAADRVADFAEREGLSAHARSITCRFAKEDA